MTDDLLQVPTSVVLPRAAQPRVSVIVLAWRQHELLRRCLASVAAAGGHAIPFEVVILLNGAAPEVVRVVDHEISGATVVRSRVNLGFAGGCNAARKAARGEYLLLLNDDTEVEPGWMEALVRTLDDHPVAGAAGSRVLFVDGTVQEAGCVIWNDGSTATVGRDAPDVDRRHGYLRPVDYCSACSLLVRTSTWDALGGLDERYFPGYYEDVDLCLALREHGQVVLYQPASRVFHHESQSLDGRYKAFVLGRSKAAFVEKWKAVLPRFLAPGGTDVLDRAVEHARGSRRVLIIDDRLPDPGAGSGFGRMYETVTELMDGGWSVSVHDSDRVGGGGSALGAMGVEVVADLSEQVARPSVAYDAVIVSRPNNFDRFAHLIRHHQPGATLVYDAEALYHRRVARRIELADEPGTPSGLRSEYQVMLDLETRIACEADLIVAISEDEAGFFRGVCEHAPVYVRPPLSWSTEPGPAGFAERADIVMVAGWLAGAESPNADGLRWFVRAVSPIVRARVPWVRLLVTGADPPASVRELAGPHVTFLGRVPDLADVYGRARVAVAPIRYGAGVKIKTTEALEHGVPVVATSTGAEGIGDGALSAIRVADDAGEFAEHVISLLSSRSQWEAQRSLIMQARSAGGGVSRPSWPSLLTRGGQQRHRLALSGPGS